MNQQEGQTQYYCKWFRIAAMVGPEVWTWWWLVVSWSEQKAKQNLV